MSNLPPLLPNALNLDKNKIGEICCFMIAKKSVYLASDSLIQHTYNSLRWPFCWMINENVRFGNWYFFFWKCRRSRKLSTKYIQRIKHIKSGWKMKNSMQLLNMQNFGIPALFKSLSTIILLFFLNHLPKKKTTLTLFPYFNLFMSIFIQSYVNSNLHVSTVYTDTNRLKKRAVFLCHERLWSWGL